MEQTISTTCCETEPMIRKRHNKIQIGCYKKDHTVRYFLTGVAVLTLISFLSLDIDWYKLLVRLPEIPLDYNSIFGNSFRCCVIYISWNYSGNDIWCLCCG